MNSNIFIVEYAKSSMCECDLCDSKILEKDLKIAKLLDTTKNIFDWFHVDCFLKKFSVKSDELQGLYDLRWEDIIKFKESFSLKRKNDEIFESESKIPKISADLDALKTQNTLFWEVKDALQSNMTNAQMHKILVLNNQDIEKQNDRKELIDSLTDLLCFGALKKCKICNGQQIFKTFFYKCRNCRYETNHPERENVLLNTKCDFLHKYKFKVQCRILQNKVQGEENDVSASLTTLPQIATNSVLICEQLENEKDVSMVSSKENFNNVRQKDEENHNKCVQEADQFSEIPLQFDGIVSDFINKNEVVSSAPMMPQIASKSVVILKQQENKIRKSIGSSNENLNYSSHEEQGKLDEEKKDQNNAIISDHLLTTKSSNKAGESTESLKLLTILNSDAILKHQEPTKAKSKGNNTKCCKCKKSISQSTDFLIHNELKYHEKCF